jgi:hypothetical protein
MKKPPKPSAFILPAGVAAACALGLGLLLASLSAPPDFKERLAVVQQRAERAQRLLRPPRNSTVGSPDALCFGDAAKQSQALRDAVSAQAAQANLTLESLDARIEMGDQLGERLTPVRLRFSATGSYEGAIALLAELGRYRPQLFVDTLDLTPKTANVTLAISGRVFCSA